MNDYRIENVKDHKEIKIAFQEFKKDFYNLRYQDGAEYDMYIQRIIDNAEVYIVYIEDARAGMICFYCNDQERKYAYLTSLVVKSAYRGKGISRCLLESMEQHCLKERMRVIGLEVQGDNKVARCLYKKFNYSEIEWRENSVLYMSKTLGM